MTASASSIAIDARPEVQYLLRLGARVKAWDEGAWVREAALAHARKQTQRNQTRKEAA